MQTDTAPNVTLNVQKLGLLNLKAQLFSNVFFGPPLLFFVLVYMGEAPHTVFTVELFYILVAALFFGPFNYFIPRVLTSPIQKTIFQWKQDVSVEQIKDTVKRLLDVPAKNALLIFSSTIIGFIVGAIAIEGWLAPELQQIKLEAIIVTVLVGFSVGGIQAFLVYMFLEEHIRKFIQHLVKLNPAVLSETLKVNRFPLPQKLFVLTFLSTIATQFSLMGLYVGKVARASNEPIWYHLFFIGACVALSLMYVLFGVKYFTANLLQTIQALKSWSHAVTRGKKDAQLDIVTNDEFADVVHDMHYLVKKFEDEQKFLEQEKNKVSVILSGLVEGVIATDDTGTILMMNDAAAKITGWKAGDTKKRSVQDIMILFDEHDNQLLTPRNVPLQSIIDDVKPSQNWPIVRLQTHQGEERFINLTTSHLALNSVGGNGCIFTFHDITKEKELEEMKLDFVSIAAHELRTPLTSVLGYTSVFLQENREKLDDEQSKLLGRVQASAKQLSGLIENLLSVSKIERGVLTLSTSSVDWQPLVEQLIEDLRFQAEDKRVQLEFKQPSEEIPSVEVDELRIKEVLSNLITNAINYTPPSGTVQVRIEHTPEGVVTHVKDSGIGIPQDALPKLFTKFFRVQGKIGHESKGTGLGLYISKVIIEMHHGRIWVESELDVGSTFSFVLPVKE